MMVTIGFLQDGYNSQSTRFAMMDTDIQDLVGIIIITTIIVLVIIIVIIVNVQIVTKITLKVRTRKAELTIGPVVFKHFMLNNDGRSIIFPSSSQSPLSLSSQQRWQVCYIFNFLTITTFTFITITTFTFITIVIL